MKKGHLKTLSVLLTIAGANVKAPESVAKPFIDKVEGMDAWTDLQIALGKADEKMRKVLIIAAIVKFLKHLEMLEIGYFINEFGPKIFEYVKEHPECREDNGPEDLYTLLDEDDEMP